MIQGNVMLVDDDQITLEMVSHALNGLIDGEVLEFSSSVMAKSFIQQSVENDFQLLICDLHMPKVNGFEILKTLRQQNKQVPCLMVTGDATRASVIEAIKSGASDFIAKPFTTEDLTSKVLKLLN